MVVPATQVPLPSQVEAEVSMLLGLLQTAVPHTVPPGAMRQAPAPSQVPSRLQVTAGSGPHDGWPVAGIWPTGTGEHLPVRPGRLQTLQASVQVVSQQ